MHGYRNTVKHSIINDPLERHIIPDFICIYFTCGTSQRTEQTGFGESIHIIRVLIHHLHWMLLPHCHALYNERPEI